MPSRKDVVRAARQAVRSGAVEGVVLFGSRARGDAHEHSDWDLCLVGGPDETRALDALSSTLRDEDVDLVWTDARAPVHEGTVWAGIIREGRPLAGRWERLMKKEIRAVSAQRVEVKLGHLLAALRDCDAYLEEIPSIPGTRETLEMRSTQGAETAGALCCAVAGIKHTGRHEMDLVGQALATAARNEPQRRGLLETMAALVADTDGATRQVRRAEYIGPLEPLRASVRRLEAARTLAAALVRGTLHATGPLAALHDDPHAREYAAAVAAAEPAASRRGQWERLYDPAPRRAPGALQALLERALPPLLAVVEKESALTLGDGSALTLRWNHRDARRLECFALPGQLAGPLMEPPAYLRARLERAASPEVTFEVRNRQIGMYAPEGRVSLASRAPLHPDPGPVERVGDTEVRLEPVAHTLVHIARRAGNAPRPDAPDTTPLLDILDLAAADVYAPHALRTALGALSRPERARLVVRLDAIEGTWDDDCPEIGEDPVRIDIARPAPATVLERARAHAGQARQAAPKAAKAPER